MYKKLFAIAIIAIFASLAGAKAQTADEILKKHYEVMGGVEKHDKITTVFQVVEKEIKNRAGNKGKIVYSIWTEYPSKRRMEVKIDIDTIHISNTIVITEKGGWVLGAENKLEEIPEDQAEDAIEKIKQVTFFEKDRLDFNKEFKAITFAGKERTNGTTCFKLRVTSKEDQEQDIYFDKEAYTIIKQKITVMDEGGSEHEIEFFSKDYKNVDGFLVEHTYEMYQDGDMADKRMLSKIEFNKPFDAKLFEKPEGKVNEKK